MMRNRFDQQLRQLHVEMVKLGALCETAISAAAKALLEQDAGMARRASATEVEIDSREREIEQLCLELLLRQQPVARDLRTISAALKMLSDLERIGDQASDIAELTRFTGLIPDTGREHISEMARTAVGLLGERCSSVAGRPVRTLPQKVVVPPTLAIRESTAPPSRR